MLTPLSILRLVAIIRISMVYRLDRLFALSEKKRKYGWLRPGLWLARNLLAPVRSRCYLEQTPQNCLRLALIELGPIFIKFGQLLSTRIDLFDAQTINQLSELQDRVPAFPNQQARAIIEQDLKASIDTLFAEFDQDVIASASIAQVYGARLVTGEQVIVKVVRPGIEHSITRDIKLMRRLARLIERIWPPARKLHLPEVVDNYHKTITGELDMEREAASCSQLRRNFTDSTLLYVPEVYWKLCSPRVLTQERIHGIAVNDTTTMDRLGISRKVLASKGVEIFFTQVFDHSFFHADMHPGNIFVMRNSATDPRYVGVDFGIMGSLSNEDQYYLAMNLLAFFQQDYRRVAELHVESGWVRPDTRVEELETAVRSVCEPIFSLPIKEISFGKIITRLFQTAREFDMEVQPQLILLQKTLFHIEGLGRQLYPDLDLWATAKPFLERWIRRRAGPKRLIEKLRQQAPDWIETLPTLPAKIEATNKGLQALPQLLKTQQIELQQLRRTQRLNNWLLVLLFLLLGVLLMLGLLPAGTWLEQISNKL